MSTQARLVEAHNVLNILLRLGEEAVNQMVKRCAVGVLRQVALYYCFTTSLLLLYYCFTTVILLYSRGVLSGCCGRWWMAWEALLLISALLLLATALLLLYYTGGGWRGGL